MGSEFEVVSAVDETVLQYLQNPQDFIKGHLVKPIPSTEQERCLGEVREFLAGEESIFVFVIDKITKKDILAPASITMDALYSQYKDDNLILNLYFEKEAVFG